MPEILTANVTLPAAIAFAAGSMVGILLGALFARRGSSKRDPRDDRIRSLTAELRIAQSETEKQKHAVEELQKQLEEAKSDIEKRDGVITHQQQKLDAAKKDLQESVRKTRELRAELQDRATESVRSEARLREVETELSVAQASTDLIATGVLDYSLAPDQPEEDNDSADASKAAS